MSEGHRQGLFLLFLGQTSWALSFSARVCAIRLCISRFMVSGKQWLVEPRLTKINLASPRVDYLREMAHQVSQQKGMIPQRSAFQRNLASYGGFLQT